MVEGVFSGGGECAGKQTAVRIHKYHSERVTWFMSISPKLGRKGARELGS